VEDAGVGVEFGEGFQRRTVPECMSLPAAGSFIVANVQSFALTFSYFRQTFAIVKHHFCKCS
jgi:hypothetical protein